MKYTYPRDAMWQISPVLAVLGLKCVAGASSGRVVHRCPFPWFIRRDRLRRLHDILKHSARDIDSATPMMSAPLNPDRKRAERGVTVGNRAVFRRVSSSDEGIRRRQDDTHVVYNVVAPRSPNALSVCTTTVWTNISFHTRIATNQDDNARPQTKRMSSASPFMRAKGMV